MKYAALLRGINVGGRSKLAMSDLRKLLSDMGLQDVATYLQSGNAVFATDESDARKLERQIEQRLTDDLGMSVKVLLRTHHALNKVVEDNPFPEAVVAPSAYYVAFLSEQPSRSKVEEIDRSKYDPDLFHVGDRAIYLHLRGGFHRTKLGIDFWEKRFGATASVRNWNTVTKLTDLTRET